MSWPHPLRSKGCHSGWKFCSLAGQSGGEGREGKAQSWGKQSRWVKESIVSVAGFCPVGKALLNSSVSQDNGPRELPATPCPSPTALTCAVAHTNHSVSSLSPGMQCSSDTAHRSPQGVGSPGNSHISTQPTPAPPSTTTHHGPTCFSLRRCMCWWSGLRACFGVWDCPLPQRWSYSAGHPESHQPATEPQTRTEKW